MLVGYIEEPDPIPLDAQFVDDGITHDDIVISEEDIPTGNSTEDRRRRQGIIYSFYEDWKLKNPDQKKYNIALKEDINIRSVSLDETAGQASITYLSTLAVLQLDAILTNAWLVKDVSYYWPDEAPEYKPAELEAIPGTIGIDTVITHTAPSFCELNSHIGLQSWAEWDSAVAARQGRLLSFNNMPL